MRHVSDLPSDEFYYRHFNSGWTGDMSMLTQALNAKGHSFQESSDCDPQRSVWGRSSSARLPLARASGRG